MIVTVPVVAHKDNLGIWPFIAVINRPTTTFQGQLSTQHKHTPCPGRNPHPSTLKVRQAWQHATYLSGKAKGKLPCLWPRACKLAAGTCKTYLLPWCKEITNQLCSDVAISAAVGNRKCWWSVCRGTPKAVGMLGGMAGSTGLPYSQDAHHLILAPATMFPDTAAWTVWMGLQKRS